MNAIFRMLGVSKQSFHQQLDRRLQKLEEEGNLLPLIRQIREDHPRLSARKMYSLIRPSFIGRDQFEAFCFEHGFKLEVKKSWTKTTNSLGVTRFPNLLLEFEVTGVNQVWVSDITYYRIADRFYYLTFIMDLHSRRIVGYSVSKDLSTENTTIVALKQAIYLRKPSSVLILHSDGGGQYYCKEFLKITRKYGIRNSMCDTVYENPHAERINGIIKNDYVSHYGPESFDRLKLMVKKAVEMYNYIRPHGSLSGLSPITFEELLTKPLVLNKRKKNQKRKDITTNLIFENRYKNLLKTVNVI
jgi:transposase InsO family protein